jgi:integrase/recombinase XerD
LPQAIDRFLHFLSVEKAAADNTVAAYRNDLGQVADHVMGRLPRQEGVGWGSVDRGMVQEFVLELGRRGYTQSSVARKVAVVRSFFAFLIDEGIIVSNPTDGLSSPRVAKMRSKPMSLDELDELLQQPTKRRAPKGKRDRAMLEVLCATGIRVSELVSLDVSDVRQDQQPLVRCPARGAKERTIPIHDEAAEAVRLYLDAARPLLVRSKNEAALFVNQRGERLTRQGVWLILKRHAEAAGLGSRISPQAVRRSVVAHLLRGRMPPNTVQEMLGHSHASTARVYLRLDGGPQPS